MSTTNGDDALSRFAHNPGFERTVLSVELQLLWGFFLEHERQFDAPTNAYDRVTLSLVLWLSTVHGYDWAEAVGEAKAVEGLFNKADPLFDAISDVGRGCYTTPQEDSITRTLQAIRQD